MRAGQQWASGPEKKLQSLGGEGLSSLRNSCAKEPERGSKALLLQWKTTLIVPQETHWKDPNLLQLLLLALLLDLLLQLFIHYTHYNEGQRFSFLKRPSGKLPKRVSNNWPRLLSERLGKSWMPSWNLSWNGKLSSAKRRQIEPSVTWRLSAVGLLVPSHFSRSWAQLRGGAAGQS